MPVDLGYRRSTVSATSGHAWQPATGHRRNNMSSRKSIRRSLAAVLSVGTLFLATACAGDDLNSDSKSEDTPTSSPTESATETGGGSAGGPLTLAGQSFPEATLVASMYTQLLEKAGYDVTEKLVDTRDGYMADFPGGVDVVPEYVGGIVNFLNSQKNGENATP